MTATNKSAEGVTGFLLNSFGSPTNYFRVYNKDKTFTDYIVSHSDLEVKIVDKDAYFYEEDGKFFLDHSPQTLGITK